MSQFTQDLILYYFMIGTGLTLLLDLMVRIAKTSEPYTAIEVLACIMLWPILLIVIIVNFVKGFKDV